MLTYLQQLWLYTRGGRTERDVIYIDGEPFVEMRKHYEDIPYQVPSDVIIKFCKAFHRRINKGYIHLPISTNPPLIKTVK